MDEFDDAGADVDVDVAPEPVDTGDYDAADDAMDYEEDYEEDVAEGDDVEDVDTVDDESGDADVGGDGGLERAERKTACGQRVDDALEADDVAHAPAR